MSAINFRLGVRHEPDPRRRPDDRHAGREIPCHTSGEDASPRRQEHDDPAHHALIEAEADIHPRSGDAQTY
jgi:hypothetical protein